MIHPSTFLSRALLADAIFSGVAAVALTLGAGALAPVLNLLVLVVIAGNAAWTLGSIALLFSGAVSPNLLGQIFIVAQAIATGVFAELQFIGLRKSGDTVAA
jgi:hypothetical protein